MATVTVINESPLVFNRNNEKVMIAVMRAAVVEPSFVCEPVLMKIIPPNGSLNLKIGKLLNKEGEVFCYSSTGSNTFIPSRWVRFDTSQIMTAKCWEVLINEEGNTSIVRAAVPMSQLVQQVKLNKPWEKMTCLTSETEMDMTVILMDGLKDAEMSLPVYIANIDAGTKRSFKEKSLLGGGEATHGYMAISSQLFQKHFWLPFPIQKLHDGEFIMFHSAQVRSLIVHKTKEMGGVSTSRAATWMRHKSEGGSGSTSGRGSGRG